MPHTVLYTLALINPWREVERVASKPDRYVSDAQLYAFVHTAVVIQPSLVKDAVDTSDNLKINIV